MYRRTYMPYLLVWPRRHIWFCRLPADVLAFVALNAIARRYGSCLGWYWRERNMAQAPVTCAVADAGVNQCGPPPDRAARLYPPAAARATYSRVYLEPACPIQRQPQHPPPAVPQLPATRAAPYRAAYPHHPPSATPTAPPLSPLPSFRMVPCRVPLPAALVHTTPYTFWPAPLPRPPTTMPLPGFNMTTIP